MNNNIVIKALFFMMRHRMAVLAIIFIGIMEKITGKPIKLNFTNV
jgi:hypothetical protein